MKRVSAVAAVLMFAAVLDTSTAASENTALGWLTLAGKSYSINGPAECNHTTAGSIYDVPATMWSVRADGAGGLHLSATIWQPKDGSDPQINFSALTGSASFTIATAKGGTIKGSASATTERKGPKGTLVIQGKTALGQTISMTVTCSGFTAPEDNG